MRKIATKLLFSIVIVTIIYSAFLLYQTYLLTNKRVKDVVEQEASMALKFDLAIRKYVKQNIRPLMYELLGKDEFLPETMSTSYVARTIFEDVRSEFPDYILKFSSDNPRNPVNQAGPEELKVIERFNNNPELNRWEGMVLIDGKQYMAKFSARRMRESCLRCHGDPKDAPASLLKIYGATAGFHRPINEVIGTDTIAIPMATISEQLWTESIRTFIVSGLGLLLFFLAIIFTNRFVITNRLTMISKHFVDAARQEDYSNIRPIDINGKDEISDLASSFNTLSDKLKIFYSSLDRQVKERTKELADKNEQLQLEIEERRRAEETLQEREAFIKTILDNLPIGVAVNSIDPSVKFEYMNDNFSKFYRTTRDTLADPDGFWNAVYEEPGFREKMKKRVLDDCASGDLKRMYWPDVPITRKGDQTSFITARNIPVSDKQLMISTVWDVTERNRAEQSLRESEEKYRNLFENLYDVYYRTDDKGIITLVSPSIERYTGYTPDELIGRNMQDFYVQPKRREEFLSLLFKDGYIDNFEAQLKRKDNSIIWVSTNAKLLKDEEDKFLGVEGISRDITYHKELEGQIRQTQKMDSIGTLAGGIAHDFNNIIGIILGNTELAIDDLPEWNPVRLNLDEIRTASLRAKDVVRQLLSFARKTKLEKKPINISPIVKESLQLLRSSIPTSVEIRQNVPEYIGTIFGDPTQINQVLINLCTNADHAMPDGGIIAVTLKKVKTDKGDEDLHPELKPGPYVNLAVSDTGKGISQEEIDRIFDPYYTTKEIGRGTGMGLAVVHGIIKGHNGIIEVASEPGIGTTFNIYFPIVEKKAVIERETDEQLPSGNERILFVDDEESIVKLGRLRLERMGYKVEATTSPIKALDLFRSQSNKFDLVITDMAMPKMTGDKLVKEVLNIRPDIPVILCTGFSEKIDETIAKEIGVADYLEKPLGKRDFALKIRKVLDDK
jgi:PAS domain S-box-containing protein